jgi:TRAP-type C4-dicarboxylate transport system permease small subunit
MKKLLELYERFLKLAITILMFLLVIPVSLQIVSRYTELIPRYIWTEEAARSIFIWMITIGSVIAVREQTHFNVDVLPKPKTARGKALAVLIVDCAMLAMATIFVVYGWEFLKFGWTQTSELTGINMAVIFSAFLLAGLGWTLSIAERTVENLPAIFGGKNGAR